LRFARFASSGTLLQSPGAKVGAGDFTAEAVGFTAGAVGLLEDITVEAVAGMAAGLLPTAAWPTWVMGGVAMH